MKYYTRGVSRPGNFIIRLAGGDWSRRFDLSYPHLTLEDVKQMEQDALRHRLA